MVYHPQDTTLAFVPLNVRPTFMSTSDVHVQVCFISKIGASRVSTYTIFNIPKNAPSPYIHAACAPATRSDGRPRATHATCPATCHLLLNPSPQRRTRQDGRRYVLSTLRLWLCSAKCEVRSKKTSVTSSVRSSAGAVEDFVRRSDQLRFSDFDFSPTPSSRPPN